MTLAAWRLARPRLLPFVLSLPGLGYGLAHWDRALPLVGFGSFLGVLGAWTALHAGTLWLNAALDRDEGPVLLGSPAGVPPGLVRWGIVALGVAVGVGLAVDVVVGGLALAAAVLAWAYSRPGDPWKARPWLGPVVNVVGYGVLSPLAGVVVVGVAPTPRLLASLALVPVGVLGSFFLAQAFQGPEDRARGYGTYVARHGAAATIRAARTCFGLAAFGALALVAVGWWPRVLLGVLPVALGLDRALVRWGDDGEAASAEGALVAARWAVGVAACAVALAFADHAARSLAGLPVAGLGTPAGRPFDGMAVRRGAADR